MHPTTSSSFISPLPVSAPLRTSNHQRTGFHGIHLREIPSKQRRSSSRRPAIIARVRQPSHSSGPPLRAAVLVSGGGRSLSNLCERIESNLLSNVSICVAIASKKSAGAIDIAEGYKLPVRVVNAKEYSGRSDEYSAAVTDVLDEFNPDLVVMAGWMHFYRIPAHYTGKVINIHPSLIPSFCGKGYFGDRVHRAVLEFGAKISGCTVHFADNEYDHGPIIVQKSVSVVGSDTVDELAARVFEAEKEALPEAIQLWADGRLQLQDRTVTVLEPTPATAE